ncbi:phage major capsid protein [Roseibium alexandrii]|uniref:Phage major capsid protein, HK97 family n=1 Tax=Roseibium alexandrii (strain DSM 17067 / NCIMB 14079 / DFL-11) TaxID=244592 RepID=A0A5E8GUU2_ROSAD|nr:phage major capsid protein [Roseibium alexandrii]EEE43300.2 phage major capsid protein, HK97 family [Roseibium alexandrii DFL-11]
MKHLMPARVSARGLCSVRADASGDIAQLITALNKDFSAFKETLEAKEQETARRFEDVVTTDKLERINASVGELQAAVDMVNAQMAALEMGGLGGSAGPVDADYTKAFQAHFRRGDVEASLNKGTDSEGGYLAPVEWDRTITGKLIEVSPMRQVASLQQISGTTYRKVFNLRGTASGWVGETAARPETDTASIAEMPIATGEIYAKPAATQQLLDDAEIDAETWLAGEVETEFAFQESNAFIAGDGANKPHGFLTFADGAANANRNPLGPIKAVPAAASADVTSDELLDVIYALPSVYTQNARWVMNRTSLGTIRKLKDGQGNYLWQPSAQAGQPATLHGYPVSEMAGMPDMAANALSIAFGDFRRGYLIVDRVGIRVLRDPYTNKPYVLFYTTKRVGGSVIDPQALKVIKHA